MARREKFGKLVLLEEKASAHLGVEYCAARLGPAGLDRLVSVMRYAEAVSAHPEATERLIDEARRAARLQDPGLLRLLGVGRVGTSFYISSELIEGRSLRSVIDRCRQERFPFTIENALMVASRTAAALEYLHDRKDETDRSLFHGLLHPGHVIVSYDGDVRVAGFGIWSSLRDTGLLGEDDRRYLAPEQAAGGPGDPRSDIHALGRLLLEMLTLEPPESQDPVAALSAARVVGSAGDADPLPESVEELLRRALAAEPSSRHQDMARMRRSIDVLLFSGEFASTTFNLAFFMHTLFREEMEREAQRLDEARRADYSEFLPAPAPVPPLDAAPTSESTSAQSGSDSTVEVARPSPAETMPVAAFASAASDSSGGGLGVPSPSPPDSSGAALAQRARRTPSDSSGSRTAHPRSPRGAREAASGLSFARPSGPGRSRRGLVLLVGLLVAAALGSGAGYVYFLRQQPAVSASPTTTLSPEALAALARVRELEERIAELEREKAEAERQEEAAPPEAASPPPPTSTQAVDEEAQRARAEARLRARLESERRQAEIRRLEEEKRAAEERLVLEQKASLAGSDPATPPALPTVAPPPPTPAPPVTTLPPVAPGTLVEANDPELLLPVLLREGRIQYPPQALQLSREGSVLVEVLVDEKGSVAEVKVLQSSGFSLGFEQAAVNQVKSRRYRPATKRGVPVRVRIGVRVNFTLSSGP